MESKTRNEIIVEGNPEKFTQAAMLLKAFKAEREDVEAPLDLEAFGIKSREAYLAFVAEWKACWHARVAACRSAQAARREKGGDFDADYRRANANEARELERERLRALHALRVRAKSASRERARRLAAEAA